MTDTRQQPYGSYGRQSGGNGADWWSRRPRRSRSDSKIAGVAGGLGRYLNVDPVLFRVGFVALTLLGGAGVLAYCVLWLLLPADGDEVSAGESLIGRGRSSVSPVLAVGLALLVIISVTSSVAWGLPFWPVAIAAFVLLHIARKQRRGPFRPGNDWQRHCGYMTESLRTNEWQGDWAPPSSGGGGQQRSGHRGGWGWGCSSSRSSSSDRGDSAGVPDQGSSPFTSPAFWDSAPTESTAGATSPTGEFGVSGANAAWDSSRPPSAPNGPYRTPTMTGRGSFSTGPMTGPVSTPPSADGFEPQARAADAPRTTPPAWDPLGAAPFAWDLPDIEVAPQQTTTLQRRSASPAIGRAATGTMLFVVAIQVLGMLVGWWSMAWALISGTALAIIALGLLLQAVRGRTLTLVLPGILLSAVTIGLAITGVSGLPGVGERTWTPAQVSSVDPSYTLGAGNAVLDLSHLNLSQGQTVSTSVEVNAGEATVILPASVNADVTCSANAGEVFCVGLHQDGLDVSQHYEDRSNGSNGTVELTVHAGAGHVEVIRGAER